MVAHVIDIAVAAVDVAAAGDLQKSSVDNHHSMAPRGLLARSVVPVMKSIVDVRAFTPLNPDFLNQAR